jgi:hypothetical protein
MQVLPDACATYLRSILETWNGVTGQAIILELLTYLSPDPAGSYEGMTRTSIGDLCLQD